MSNQPNAEHRLTESDLEALYRLRDTLVECSRIARRISRDLSRYNRNADRAAAAVGATIVDPILGPLEDPEGFTSVIALATHTPAR
jgi:hypothetical protein